MFSSRRLGMWLVCNGAIIHSFSPEMSALSLQVRNYIQTSNSWNKRDVPLSISCQCSVESNGRYFLFTNIQKQRRQLVFTTLSAQHMSAFSTDKPDSVKPLHVSLLGLWPHNRLFQFNIRPFQLPCRKNSTFETIPCKTSNKRHVSSLTFVIRFLSNSKKTWTLQENSQIIVWWR